MYLTVLIESRAYGRGSRGKDCFGLLPTKKVPGWECQVDLALPYSGCQLALDFSVKVTRVWGRETETHFLISDPKRVEVGPSKHSQRLS